MTYYARHNTYGSSTSVGFANTWTVVGFVTKAARAAWIAQYADRMDVAAITANDARKMAGDYNRRRARNGGYLADVVYLTDDNKSFRPAF